MKLRFAAGLGFVVTETLNIFDDALADLILESGQGRAGGAEERRDRSHGFRTTVRHASSGNGDQGEFRVRSGVQLFDFGACLTHACEVAGDGLCRGNWLA